MNTKCVHKDLIFYIGNELSEEKREAVETHIKECADCREYLAFLQDEMLEIENEKKPEVSPYFYTRVAARLERVETPRTQWQWAHLLQPAFFSMLLLLGIYGGMKVGNNASTTIEENVETSNIQIFNDFDFEPIESFFAGESLNY